MRQPDWQSDDGRIRLFCGDCLTVLPELGAGTAECIVTDPPYGTRTDQRDEWMVGEFGNVIPLALPLIREALVKNGAFYCFTSWSEMSDWLVRYQQYFKLQNVLVWDKKRHSGCYSPHAWQFTWEGVFFGTRGPRRVREYLPDVIRSEERGKRLPMQKPVDILESMLRASTDPGQHVIDPFMGSGSTAIACLNAGRSFTGIEINRQYFDIATSRITRAIERRKGGPMFAEASA